jgi:hypothetical protein
VRSVLHSTLPCASLPARAAQPRAGARLARWSRAQPSRDRGSLTQKGGETHPPRSPLTRALVGWCWGAPPAHAAARRTHPPTHSPCACGRCVTCLPLHALLCSLAEGGPARAQARAHSGRGQGNLAGARMAVCVALPATGTRAAPVQPVPSTGSLLCMHHARWPGRRPSAFPSAREMSNSAQKRRHSQSRAASACVRACMHGRAPARRPQCGLHRTGPAGRVNGNCGMRCREVVVAGHKQGLRRARAAVTAPPLRALAASLYVRRGARLGHVTPTRGATHWPLGVGAADAVEPAGARGRMACHVSPVAVAYL